MLSACGTAGADSKGKEEKATSKDPVTIEYWHVNADTQGGKQLLS